ncbi:MAG: ABC transporter permease [Pedosphaera sp.]|nr:ABC transporter permease [Pedosphaera sp.]MSU43557.1 ABC transporter permease [Pedosphaera sp.]
MNGFSLLRIVQLGFKSLRLHKLRSGLTMLGMVIGVWAVITLVAIGEGASHDAQEAIKRLGAHNILIRSIEPTEEKTGGSSTRNFVSEYGISYHDASRIQATIPGLKRVLPEMLQRRTVFFDRFQQDCQIIGTYPFYPDFTKAQIVRGRFLSEFDDLHRNNVCVLTESLAAKLFAHQDPLESQVRVEEQYFRVIGLIREMSDVGQRPQGGEQEGRPMDSNVYIPLTTLRARFGEMDMDLRAGSFKLERVELSQLRLEFASIDLVEPAIPLIRAAMDKDRKKKDYELIVPLNILNAIKEQRARDTRMLLYIACISLLVGGIGIMNIMLATVTERTREIGVRRALGATRTDIVLQFLIETLILCLIGGLTGVAGGCAFAWAREYFFHLTTIITEWSVVAAFGLSLAVGLVFGLYPARRAAALDPIEALRHS